MLKRSNQARKLLSQWIRRQRQHLSRFWIPGHSHGLSAGSDKPWWQQDVRVYGAWIKQTWKESVVARSGAPYRFADLSTPRFRRTVLLALFISVTSLSAVLLWPVQLSKYRVLVNERQLLESRFLRQQQIIEDMPLYQRQIDVVLSQVGSLLDAVPERMEPVHVLSLINQAARDAGVQLELFRPMPETTGDHYAVLPIEIRLTGDFHGLGRFMENVSRLQHLITVDVSISPSTSQENQLVMASQLKAYRSHTIQHASKK